MEKNGMTEQEINMWSVLIAVLKNHRKDDYKIEEIEMDICDIQSVINKGYVEH
jgi:hypothetical protein